MDKTALLAEIEKVKIKHPRAEDFKKKITRADDCFAMEFDAKSEDCLRCVVKVEYDGQEMLMNELCKKFLKLSLHTKGPEMAEETAEATEGNTTLAEKTEKTTPAAENTSTAAEEKPKEEKKEATKVSDKNEAAAPAKKAAEKKVPEKKAAAPAKKAPAPAKKVPEKKAAVPAKKPAEKKAAPAKKAPAPKKEKDKNALGKREVIIMDLLKKKNMSQAELVDKMGIRGSTTNISLRGLLDKKLIDRKEEGRGFVYFLAK